jgi:Ala-tRNA(Pro) deacylase
MARAIPDDLFRRLSELGIEHETVWHDPVFTVAESQALRGTLPGGHAKNLFLKNKKGDLWLVTAAEDAAVDLKALTKTLEAGRLSFGRPDLLLEVLGVEPGSVTPFALMNDREQRVQFVFDQRLAAMEPLHFHPLVNNATTAVSASGFRAFLAWTGHQVLEVSFPVSEEMAEAGK